MLNEFVMEIYFSEVGVLLFQRSNRLQEFIISSHLFDIIRNITLLAVLRGKYLKFYFFRTYVDVKKCLTWNKLHNFIIR